MTVNQLWRAEVDGILRARVPSSDTITVEIVPGVLLTEIFGLAVGVRDKKSRVLIHLVTVETFT